jgi:hypothetical protein
MSNTPLTESSQRIVVAGNLCADNVAPAVGVASVFRRPRMVLFHEELAGPWLEMLVRQPDTETPPRSALIG